VPRKTNLPVATDSQGTLLTWRFLAAKKSDLLGGTTLPRNEIYLAVRHRKLYSWQLKYFFWHNVDLAVPPFSLAAKLPRKLSLAASRQVNRVSLALYS